MVQGGEKNIYLRGELMFLKESFLKGIFAFAYKISQVLCKEVIF